MEWFEIVRSVGCGFVLFLPAFDLVIEQNFRVGMHHNNL